MSVSSERPRPTRYNMLVECEVCEWWKKSFDLKRVENAMPRGGVNSIQTPVHQKPDEPVLPCTFDVENTETSNKDRHHVKMRYSL